MNFAPPRQRLTLTELTERDLAVCQMYKAGSDVLECGKPFKIGRESVYRILKKYGVPRRNGVQFEEPVVDEIETAIEIDRFESEMIRSGSKRRFYLLGDEAQAVVRKMFKRHLRACESIGCPVDIMFLPDCVFEAGRVAKLREKANVRL